MLIVFDLCVGHLRIIVLEFKIDVGSLTYKYMYNILDILLFVTLFN